MFPFPEIFVAVRHTLEIVADKPEELVIALAQETLLVPAAVMTPEQTILTRDAKFVAKTPFPLKDVEISQRDPNEGDRVPVVKIMTVA